MNLPNAITLARMVVTVGVFACLECVADVHQPQGLLAWWAFGLFLFAAVTDFIDGYLARKFDQVSMFGRVFDPLADKVLICGTFIVLLRFPSMLGLCPTWFVTIVIVRELLVTTLRGAAESSGVAFPADNLGKLKMLAQSATAAAMLSVLAGSELFLEVAQWGMWVTLFLTVVSGGGYVLKSRSLLFAK